MSPSFEEQYQELEAIVAKLEGGKLSVEESMLSFRSGVALVSALKKRLTEVENQVVEIKKSLEDEASGAP